MVAPTVTGIGPTSGPAGRRYSGDDQRHEPRHDGHGQRVCSGTSAATITSDTGTVIIVAQARGQRHGWSAVTTTTGGTSGTALPMPTVSRHSNGDQYFTGGPPGGGTPVTISGHEPGGWPQPACCLGRSAATIMSDTGTVIVATSPPGSGHGERDRDHHDGRHVRTALPMPSGGTRHVNGDESSSREQPPGGGDSGDDQRHEPGHDGHGQRAVWDVGGNDHERHGHRDRGHQPAGQRARRT